MPLGSSVSYQSMRRRAFVFKRGVWPLSVVKSDPSFDYSFGLKAFLQLVQIDGLLLEGSPEPFDEDIVEVPPIH